MQFPPEASLKTHACLRYDLPCLNFDNTGLSCFIRLGRICIPLPAFQFNFQTLNRNGIGIGIKIRHGGIFTHPTGMQKIAQGLESAARKYDRPVIFTEIGFTSTERSWKQPHEDGRGKPPYFGDQEKCYRAVFETLWQKPWFYGFYWWKWPTYLERGGMRHSSFTPNGKPAEKVLAKWYAKTWKTKQ